MKRFAFLLLAFTLLLAACSQTTSPTEPNEPSTPEPNEPSPITCVTDTAVFEAEDALITGDALVITKSEDASGGSFVHVPDSNKPGGLTYDDTDEPQSVHILSFCFNISEAGTYKVQTWVAGEDDSDDSFWVVIDNKIEEAFQYSYADITRGLAKNAKPFPLFTEDYVKAQGVGDIKLELTAGQHTIAFHYRESDSRLDKIKLEQIAVANLY